MFTTMTKVDRVRKKIGEMFWEIKSHSLFCPDKIMITIYITMSLVVFVFFLKPIVLSNFSVSSSKKSNINLGAVHQLCYHDHFPVSFWLQNII